jgi:hypothetical protein
MSYAHFDKSYKIINARLNCVIIKSQNEFEKLMVLATKIKIAYHIRALQNRFKNIYALLKPYNDQFTIILRQHNNDIFVKKYYYDLTMKIIAFQNRTNINLRVLFMRFHNLCV